MTYWVYILASKPGGTLYVGVRNDLVRRICEHREGLADGFTKRYGVKSLVYFEPHEAIASVVDLTFASVLPRLLQANVKSKTTLESNIC